MEIIFLKLVVSVAVGHHAYVCRSGGRLTMLVGTLFVTFYFIFFPLGLVLFQEPVGHFGFCRRWGVTGSTALRAACWYLDIISYQIKHLKLILTETKRKINL